MQIKLEFNSWAEALEFARQITETPAPAATAMPAPAPVAAPAPAPAPTPTPAPVAAPAPAKKVTRQDVQTKAIALMDAGKQEQLQGLLLRYNAPALPSIPEEQLAAFMADLERL